MPAQETKPTARIWLEYRGEPILGYGGARILEAIKEERSISKAARKLGMSYRYVWNYLLRIRNATGESVVKTFKGGRSGGGGAMLTPLGDYLLREYRRLENYVGEVLGDEEYWEAVGLKISARNRLKGVVKSVERGDVVTKVRLEIEVPTTITALISTEAADDLDIKVNDRVEAVIKSTEVMIAKGK